VLSLGSHSRQHPDEALLKSSKSPPKRTTNDSHLPSEQDLLNPISFGGRGYILKQDCYLWVMVKTPSFREAF